MTEGISAINGNLSTAYTSNFVNDNNRQMNDTVTANEKSTPLVQRSNNTIIMINLTLVD